LTPGRLVVALFGKAKPGLDVFTSRTGVIAGRQAVNIDRAFGAPATGFIEKARADIQRDGKGF